MRIRNATELDVSSILPLLVELGYPQDFDVFAVRFKYFLQSPEYGIAVCELNGAIVGAIA